MKLFAIQEPEVSFHKRFLVSLAGSTASSGFDPSGDYKFGTKL